MRRKLQFEEADKLQEVNVVEPTIQEWASPAIFVPKKEKSLCFIVKYRSLNAETVHSSWFIPRMYDRIKHQIATWGKNIFYSGCKFEI